MKKIVSFGLIFLSVLLLSACQGNRPLKDDEDFGLAQVKDYEELTRLINDSNKTNWLFDRLSPQMEADGVDDSSGGDESSDHSSTNVQVDGVDEGDIVKTDGNIIITIADNRLNVIRVLEDGQMEIIMQSAMDLAYAYYTDLYLTDDYIIAIGYHYEYTYFTNDGSVIEDGITTDDYYYGYGNSATFVEIYNRDDYTLKDTFEISGYLMTSRLIDNQLIFISNMSVFLHEDIDPRPYVKENEDISVVDYEDIKYIPDTSYNNFVMITSILLDSTNTIETEVFLGSGWWSNIYINTEEIYIATTYYDFSVFGESKPNGLLVSYIFNEEGLEFGGS
ncbi:MAG: beta-propeller domain-containing protein, partial [Candidatus Izemoplasmataceae bacterium]